MDVDIMPGTWSGSIRFLSNQLLVGLDRRSTWGGNAQSLFFCLLFSPLTI